MFREGGEESGPPVGGPDGTEVSRNMGSQDVEEDLRVRLLCLRR